MPSTSDRSSPLTETTRITLERTRVFSGLPSEVLAALRLAMCTRDVAADTYLYRDGDLGDGTFIIRSGMVALIKRQGSSPTEMAVRGPGEIVGEDRLIDDAPRFCDALCKTDCQLFALSRKDFYRVIATYPQVAQHVLAVLTARVREADLRQLAELRRRADELQQYITEHDRLAIKGEMAAEIAHDLRNFLGALAGYLDLVTADALEGRTTDLGHHVQGMRRAYEQIRLFADSLLCSQHPSGEKAVIHLNEFLAEQISFLQHQDRLKHLAFSTDLDPALPLIFADAALLQQAIYTLVVNAAEAMQASATEAPTILMQTQSQPADETVLLTVADNGPGIPTALMPCLFKKRVSAKPTGHGFGLLNVARIVGGHGGTISACNRPGGGAEFTITLPCGEPGRGVTTDTPAQPSRHL